MSFKHTDARRTELEETLNRHLTTNSLSPKDAESLRGRLIWFEFSFWSHCKFVFARNRQESNSTWALQQP